MKIPIILSLIFISISIKAQECGLTTGDMPISTYNITDDYNFAWSASLYDTYQIGGTQTITKICLSINSSGGGSSTLDGQRIWMRMTSNSSYSSCSYPGTAGFTKVYDGTITYPSSGFINITLSTSFDYNDNSQYLEILWENTNPNYDWVQDWSFDRLDANTNNVGKWGSSQTSYNSATSNCQLVKYTAAIGFNETNSVNCGVLPIRLENFTVRKETDAVKLNWITATEINNAFFTIEHSLDGINFTKIKTIKAAGNSNKQTEYYIFDNNPSDGTNYYRLKQTDFDGSFTYSKIKAVNFNKSTIVNVNIYPNPVNETLKLSLPNIDLTRIKINITDITGKEVNTSHNYKYNNEYILINVSDIKTGVYFINISADKIYRGKFIKL
jgi:hypothetical protein